MSQTPNANINPNLAGVRRYKKGRSFAETLYGKMRYGKDLVTSQWVAIKENRRWFAQNHLSTKGNPVPEDLFKEIEIHRFLMEQSDTPPHILRLLEVVEDDVFIYLILELVDGGDFFGFIQDNHQKMQFERNRELKQKSSPHLRGVGEGSDDADEDEMRYGSDEKMTDVVSESYASTEISDDAAMVERSIEELQLTDVVPEWELRMRRLFRNIVTSVEWMHRHGVCHLDISLENALIDNNDNIKIIDFGLARIFRNGDFSMNTKVGKVRCMSPEVYNGHSYDARAADVWSLGVMLFMILFGIPPWSAPSETETIYRMAIAGRIRDVIVYNNKKNMVSNNAIDLLTRFFKYEPHRITLAQVLEHPFLQQC